MTLTRKMNTFGGTNINIHLGNKTKKTISKVPILTGGASRTSTLPTGERASVDNLDDGFNETLRGIKPPNKEEEEHEGGEEDEEGEEDEGGEKKHKVKSPTPKDPNDITSTVASIVVKRAEDDEKIDKIENVLTTNWNTLYEKLKLITPDNSYDAKFKSELTQLIQEMVAVALLQTI